ncbi:MAG TPA: AgmX/PglI C-terminal domain-containing protein [Polyangiaceae bacterium]|jgi:hypothetical protein|nr:AgmX/PglI C-terminal domain-containing protein [Polyangiaceae bacterium]
MRLGHSASFSILLALISQSVVTSRLHAEPPRSVVTFEPIYAPGARPGATAELAVLENTETLARYNVGGSSDPAHPANDPKFHPAPRVVVTLEQLAPRLKGKLAPLQAHARRHGYWLIRACYEPGLRRQQSLSGKTRIRTTLGKAGSVLGARRLGGDLSDAEVRQCLVSALRKMRFPAPGRKVDADWEIAVYPGDAEVPPAPVSAAAAEAKLPAPAAALESALNGLRSELTRCLTDARARDRALWGRLAVELTLTASGSVSRVTEVETNFPHGLATACVERRLAVASFPAPTAAGARIIVALRLEPEVAQLPPAPAAGAPPAPPMSTGAPAAPL